MKDQGLDCATFDIALNAGSNHKEPVLLKTYGEKVE